MSMMKFRQITPTGAVFALSAGAAVKTALRRDARGRIHGARW